MEAVTVNTKVAPAQDGQSLLKAEAARCNRYMAPEDKGLGLLQQQITSGRSLADREGSKSKHVAVQTSNSSRQMVLASVLPL